MTTAVLEAGKVFASVRQGAIHRMEKIANAERIEGYKIKVDSKIGKFIVVPTTQKSNQKK